MCAFVHIHFVAFTVRLYNRAPRLRLAHVNVSTLRPLIACGRVRDVFNEFKKRKIEII